MAIKASSGMLRGSCLFRSFGKALMQTLKVVVKQKMLHLETTLNYPRIALELPYFLTCRVASLTAKFGVGGKKGALGGW